MSRGRHALTTALTWAAVASVVSVGSHEEADGLTFYYNPTPPVEFFGRGLDLDVAWLDGGVGL